MTLLNDRSLAGVLGANARATVLAEFDWRQICRKIERIYDQLLGASIAPVTALQQNRCSGYGGALSGLTIMLPPAAHLFIRPPRAGSLFASRTPGCNPAA